jgi:hypothetical protein
VKALGLGLLIAAALLVAAPARACGCGVALLADVTRERALIIERPGREEIIASFDLLSEGAGRAAIVLPVPSDPVVEEIEAGDPLMYLDIATRPPIDPDAPDGATAGAAGGGVAVIGRDVIGGYDVTRLNADDAGALDTWLDQNGYAMPEGAEPILAEYVDQGWRYVAIRLAAGVSGALRPLRVSFDTEQLVYPMQLSQLGTSPLDLTLYVLADGERRIEGLTESYSGAVADLEPEPPAEVAEILDAGTHITKLTALGASPASFTSDLYVEGGTGTFSGPPSDPPGWGPPLAVLLGLAGLGLLRLSRRA